MTVSILLDSENKIYIMKWTKWRDFEMENILFPGFRALGPSFTHSNLDIHVF
jgi:hypothetical protein